MLYRKSFIKQNPTGSKKQIQQLIDEKYYLGEVSDKGFIIKRNFGIRRLSLFGAFKPDGIIVQAKNELLHQSFLILGVMIMVFLIGFSLYQRLYSVSILLSILMIFLILDDQHRIQNEYKMLEESLKKLSDK